MFIRHIFLLFLLMSSLFSCDAGRCDQEVRKILFYEFPIDNLDNLSVEQQKIMVFRLESAMFIYPPLFEVTQSAICKYMNLIPLSDWTCLKKLIISSLRRNFMEVAFLLIDKIYLLEELKPSFLEKIYQATAGLMRLYELSTIENKNRVDKNCFFFLLNSFKKVSLDCVLQIEVMNGNFMLYSRHSEYYSCSNVLLYFLILAKRFSSNNMIEHVDRLSNLTEFEIAEKNIDTFLGFFL